MEDYWKEIMDEGGFEIDDKSIIDIWKMIDFWKQKRRNNEIVCFQMIFLSTNIDKDDKTREIKLLILEVVLMDERIDHEDKREFLKYCWI